MEYPDPPDVSPNYPDPVGKNTSGTPLNSGRVKKSVGNSKGECRAECWDLRRALGIVKKSVGHSIEECRHSGEVCRE